MIPHLRKLLSVLLFTVCLSHYGQEHNLTNPLNNYEKQDSIRVFYLQEESLKYYRSDPQKALALAQESYDLATQLKYTKGQARSLNIIGICYDEQSDYVRAFDNYETAATLYEALEDPKGLAKTYNNIGILYRYQGNYPLALEYYQKSLLIEEKSGDKYGASKSLNNIGVIYFFKEDYDKALDYFEKSLLLDHELGDRDGIGSSLNNIGMVYEKLEKYYIALDYYTKALKEVVETKNLKSQSNFYQSIGLCYMYLKDYTKAIKNFDISLQIAKKNNYAAQEAYTYIGLTKLYMAKGDMRAAKRYGLRAYRLSESLKQIENHKESAALVAKSSAVLGEYKDAYAYEVISRQLSDSIFNEDQIKAITRVEDKYLFEKEMEKRSLLAKEESLKKQALLDKQIILRNLSLFLLVISIAVIFFVLKINKQKQAAITLSEKQRKEIEAINLELKRNTRDLKKANTTRDKFFQIIGHDLRSPMIQLVQFAELITSNFKLFPEEKIVSLMDSIGKSTQEALNMLDNLFQWAETQKQKIAFSPESISIKSLIENNMNLAELRAKDKEIRLTATDVYDKDVVADKNIIDTLLRNLISNALKFTPRGGTIDIKNQVVDQQLITSITDSGIGIPKEILPNLFELGNRKTTYGTDNEKGTGVGLNLCNELIKRHKGKIWVESEINKGSTFNFSIPLDLNVKAT